MAATVSSLHAARVFDMHRPTTTTRDFDGNIVSNEPSETRTYHYATGLIPAKRIEELICMMTKDFRQGLFTFHQHIQGT